jgi:hypothetical protein
MGAALVDRVDTMVLETRAEQQDVAGPVNITGIDVVLSHWLADHVPGARPIWRSA